MSLLPLVRGEVDELHQEIFAEVTYHAAYEPQRAVRTARHKYVRRFDAHHPGRVLANLDDGLTKDVMLRSGWAEVDPPTESLYDLWLDPSEGTNRIDDPELGRRPGRPETAAARLDGPDRRPVARRPGGPGRRHLLQHGGPALGERPHPVRYHPEPHPQPGGTVTVAARPIECDHGSRGP